MSNALQPEVIFMTRWIIVEKMCAGELLRCFCHSWQINQISNMFDIVVTNDKNSSCAEGKANWSFNRKKYACVLLTKQHAELVNFKEFPVNSEAFTEFLRFSLSSFVWKLILTHYPFTFLKATVFHNCRWASIERLRLLFILKRNSNISLSSEK